MRMLVVRAARFRALANLAPSVLANEQSLRDMHAHTAGVNAKEITKMRYRTAVKTGRTAALQADALRPGSFVRYAEMVERLSDCYTRPLVLRFAPPKRAP